MVAEPHELRDHLASLTIKMLVRASALSLVLLCATGCRDGSDDLTGVWVGSFNQVVQERAGTIRLELSHSGASLGGRWEIEIPGDLRWGGRIDGSVTSSSVEARLVPDDREVCPYAWTATFSENRLEGPYQAFDCRVEIFGRIDTRRQ